MGRVLKTKEALFHALQIRPGERCDKVRHDARGAVEHGPGDDEFIGGGAFGNLRARHLRAGFANVERGR